MQPDSFSGQCPRSHFSAGLPRWKRTIDIICCIAALPLLGLLTLLYGAIVATVAPGPVFFRQENIGFRGRRFWLYRFRTMRVKSLAVGQPTLRGTHALVPGGGFLRASGLADLPQIINVLRGEMSMVGPCPVVENEFVFAAPSRLVAMPGVTGLWRLSQRTPASAEETTQLDFTYTGSKSLWMDSKIILLTISLPCMKALGIRNPKSSGNRLRGNVAAEAASLRAASRQPW